MTSNFLPESTAIQPIALARLRPYPGNARTHSKKQIRQIAESIKNFGFTNPVLISDEHEIIAGHGRVDAAKLLGMESVPTVRLSHLDAAQRRAYVLADNKLALNAGWDREVLAIELQALVDLQFEVEITGSPWPRSTWFWRKRGHPSLIRMRTRTTKLRLYPKAVQP